MGSGFEECRNLGFGPDLIIYLPIHQAYVVLHDISFFALKNFNRKDPVWWAGEPLGQAHGDMDKALTLRCSKFSAAWSPRWIRHSFSKAHWLGFCQRLPISKMSSHSFIVSRDASWDIQDIELIGCKGLEDGVIEFALHGRR